MPDRLTAAQRSHCMSRIRGKDTKPEILVRKGLHARGFRFRLQDRKLPGRPDIVLPKYGVAIMVNGCFWHGHKGCRFATRPKSNEEFWEAKISRNRHRDEVTVAHLEALGWTVITVWECELNGKTGKGDDPVGKKDDQVCKRGDMDGKKGGMDGKKASKAEARIDALAAEILQAGERKTQNEQRRKVSRSAARKEREQTLARQAMLEAEIRQLYPIPAKIQAESRNEI